MATAHGYTTSGFLLELDGKPAGRVVDVSGGQPVGRVAEAPPDVSGLIKRQLDGVSYEPIVLRISTGMARAMYDWIAAVPARTQQPHDGAIVFVDHTYRESARLTWTEGVITEVVLPVLDAASKDAARIVVTVQPRSTSYSRSAGGTVKQSFSSPAHAKAFLPSNFRFSIDGLPDFSKRVSKVEAISVRQDAAFEDGTPLLGAVHIGNIEVTGPEQFSSDLRTWFDNFVVGGQNSDAEERSAYVDVVAPNMKDTLLSLKLAQVGIFSLTDLRDDRGTSAIARVRAGLYAEELAVTFDEAMVGVEAPAPAPPPATPPSEPRSAEGKTAEAFFGSWRAGMRLPRAALAPEVVAGRLRGTVQPAPLVAEVTTREDEGRRFGAVWAREVATLEELEAMGALAGGEWTTVNLPDEHSLLWALDRAGETADRDLTSLSDDPFIRGIVEGAASVRRELEGHLSD